MHSLIMHLPTYHRVETFLRRCPLVQCKIQETYGFIFTENPNDTVCEDIDNYPKVNDGPGLGKLLTFNA